MSYEYYDRLYNQVLADYKRRRITLTEAKQLAEQINREARDNGIPYQSDSDFLASEDKKKMAKMIPSLITESNGDDEIEEPEDAPEPDLYDEDDEDFDEDEEDPEPETLWSATIFGHSIEYIQEGSDGEITIDGAILGADFLDGELAKLLCIGMILADTDAEVEPGLIDSILVSDDSLMDLYDLVSSQL